MSSLLCIADDRGRWAVIAADASARVPQRRLGVTDISELVDSDLAPLKVNKTSKIIITVEHRKLSWFGHVCRQDRLPKIITQLTVDDSRRRERPRKSWKYNVKEWTGQSISSMMRIADDKSRWEAVTADASVAVPQGRSSITGINYLFSNRPVTP